MRPRGAGTALREQIDCFGTWPRSGLLPRSPRYSTAKAAAWGDSAAPPIVSAREVRYAQDNASVVGNRHAREDGYLLTHQLGEKL